MLIVTSPKLGSYAIRVWYLSLKVLLPNRLVFWVGLSLMLESIILVMVLSLRVYLDWWFRVEWNGSQLHSLGFHYLD